MGEREGIGKGEREERTIEVRRGESCAEVIVGLFGMRHLNKNIDARKKRFKVLHILQETS